MHICVLRLCYVVICYTNFRPNLQINAAESVPVTYQVKQKNKKLNLSFMTSTHLK